jgi:hypothetical protein
MVDGLPLFDQPFAGDDYVDERDRPRLRGQIRRVFSVMRDGQWRTLAELAGETGDPEASVSAQLRHLRKPRFGLHTVTKRHRGEASRGLYEYHLTQRGESDAHE